MIKYMALNLGSRLSVKLAITQYENVTFENFIEITTDVESTPDLAAIERAAQLNNTSIYRKDGSFSVVRLQRVLTQTTINEWRKYRRDLKGLQDANELAL